MEIDEFWEWFVAKIETSLSSGRDYLTGYDFTVADVAYYNELQNVLMITGTTIDDKTYPHLTKWLNRIESFHCIKFGNLKLREEISAVEKVSDA